MSNPKLIKIDDIVYTDEETKAQNNFLKVS